MRCLVRLVIEGRWLELGAIDIAQYVVCGSRRGRPRLLTTTPAVRVPNDS